MDRAGPDRERCWPKWLRWARTRAASSHHDPARHVAPSTCWSRHATGHRRSFSGFTMQGIVVATAGAGAVAGAGCIGCSGRLDAPPMKPPRAPSRPGPRGDLMGIEERPGPKIKKQQGSWGPRARTGAATQGRGPAHDSAHVLQDFVDVFHPDAGSGQ